MKRNNRGSIAFLLTTQLIFLTPGLSSCAHKSGHARDRMERQEAASRSSDEAYDDRTKEIAQAPLERRERKIGDHTKVKMRESGGIYLVPITVNGLNLDFIFDTGASDISLSAAEATVMVKQGKITEDDVVGQVQFMDATGNVSVGTQVILKTVQIGDIILENVRASVVDNVSAPLLLGQTALAKFGKVTIDYEHNTIEFN